MYLVFTVPLDQELEITFTSSTPLWISKHSHNM